MRYILAFIGCASALKTTVIPRIAAVAKPPSTLAMPFDELQALVGGKGRAKSIWDAVRGGMEPLHLDAPTTVGARRALLAAGLENFLPGSVDGPPAVAADGTTKLLVRLADGLAVEAVLIPHQRLPRTTLCISSQVGCDRGCTFCATARMGLVRNLTPDEICAQVVLARRVAAQDPNMPPLTNIVFMGMGDAGRNAANVKRAAAALIDGEKFRMARSKITISTVGPSPDCFRELSDADGMLAWSVHSADDALRKKLVPSSKHTVAELREGLLDALAPRPARQRTLMLAATLIQGVNDTPEDARTLAAFVSPIVDVAQKVNVDLIPVNPTSHAPDFRRPSDAALDAFVAAVKEVEPRVHVALRVQRGDDEAAACGQLLINRRELKAAQEEAAKVTV
mmetsp:Transcript_28272/g.84651  ORF Transcript_28272/g.84651 Transcript_28272/m.84651 type:complete len:395 (+) Transcript_28272:237-1421(+)